MIKLPADILNRVRDELGGRCSYQEADRASRIVADWIEAEYRLYADRHVVKIAEGQGWVLQHPLSCRPNLFECPYNSRISTLLEDSFVTPGTYTADLVPEDGRETLALMEIGDA